jgi:hypothetical protein
MRMPRLFRLVVAVTCAYEVAAIVTRRLPTVSRLSFKHPVFGSVVIGGLAHHFRTDAHGGMR